MAIQNDNTVLNKGDLKAYHEKILPYLGGNMMMSTNNSDYYSTDEKVIGVWTDGRPIYQRSYLGNICSSTGTGTWTETTIEKPTNLDFVVFAICGDSSVIHNYIGVGTPSSASTHLFVNCARSGGVGISRMTIQYTKTTDTTTTALTTPGCYDINRPDLWPANKEVFFGNGLYGFRAIGNFTANISAGSNVWTQIADVNLGLSKAPKTYSSGGWFTFVSNGTRSYQAVNQARAGNMNSSTYFATAGTLRFQAISYTNSTMAIVSGTDNYDIWVIYTK